MYRASNPAQPQIYHRGEMAEAEPAVPGWVMAVDDLFRAIALADYRESDTDCLRYSAKGDSNMAEFILKTNQPEKAVVVVKQAIAAKIARIEYSRQQALEKLNYFEQKYHVTSEQFINEWTAEDLEGKDMEYVEWAGEYHLFLDVEADLNILKTIEYVAQ